MMTTDFAGRGVLIRPDTNNIGTRGVIPAMLREASLQRKYEGQRDNPLFQEGLRLRLLG